MNSSRIVALLLLGAVGLMAGYVFAGDGQNAGPARGETPRPLQVTALNQAGATLPSEFATIVSGGSGSAHVLLTATLRDVHDLERIRFLLERTHLLPADISQSTARGILLRNWVRADPAAAAKWAAANSKRHLRALVETWATEDLSGARNALTAIAPSSYSSLLTSAVVAEIARSTPAQALAALAELGPRVRSSDRYQLGDTIELVVGLDPGAALDPNLPIPSWLKQRLRQQAAAAMVKADPGAALEWWQQQADRRSLAASTFYKLPAGEWSRALDLLHEIDGESIQSNSIPHSVINDAYYRWAYSDPHRFFSLFAEAMASDRWSTTLQGAFERSLRSAISMHPDKAATWISGLADPDTILFAEGILGDREERTHGASADPVSSLVTDPTSIGYDTYRHLSPEQRLRLADELAATPDALPETLDQLTRHGNLIPMADLHRLLVAAPTEGDTSERIALTAGRITSRFAAYSPSDAAQWAESLPPGPIFDAVASAVAIAWNSYQPDAARAWAESLSDPNAREAALMPIDSPEEFAELQRQQAIGSLRSR